LGRAWLACREADRLIAPGRYVIWVVAEADAASPDDALSTDGFAVVFKNERAKLGIEMK
jgi:hypothetical protein